MKRKRTKVQVAPRREWDRGTELIGLFALTGHLIPNGSDRPKPQSLLLVGPPGSGKTELLMRFHGIKGLIFRSDITVRGLWRLLLLAQKGRMSHIILPEFNKVFLRKTAVAMNCVGTLAEAMEEGVWEGDVGPMKWSFHGARTGLIGGMTARTLRNKRGLLYEVGFLDRCAVIPWELPEDQKREILTRITFGDRTDISKVDLKVPEHPVKIDLPPKVGQILESYVWERWPDESLRILTRFRILSMAAALRRGDDVVKPEDVEAAVIQFGDYWDRQVITPAVEEMVGE